MTRPTDTTSTRTTAGDRPHIFQLDVLRGFAAGLVFFAHIWLYAVVEPPAGAERERSAAEHRAAYQPAAGASWWRGFGADDPRLYPFVWYSMGWVAVPVFFVISGFCIHYGSLRPGAKPGDPPLLKFSFRTYILRRFWRIYPAYLFALLLFAVVLFATSADPGGTLWIHKGNLAAHLLLIHNWRPQWIYEYSPAFWSLGLEFQFYLMYPLLLWLRSRMGIERATLAFLALGLASRAVLAPFIPLSNDAIWRGPTVTFFDWCLGALIAERFVQGRRLVNFSYWWAAPVVAAGVFLAGTRYSITAETTVWSLVAVFLVDGYVNAKRTAGWLERRLMAFGVVSYSFYLLHAPMTQWTYRFLYEWGISGGLVWDLTLGAAAAFIPILAASWLTYRLVEAPGIALGRRLMSRRSAPPLAAIAGAVLAEADEGPRRA